MTTIGRSWETAETRLLIDLRRIMEGEFASMKRNAPLWKKISDQMKNGGFHRTDKQCKEKWKNLLSEFKPLQQEPASAESRTTPNNKRRRESEDDNSDGKRGLNKADLKSNVVENAKSDAESAESAKELRGNEDKPYCWWRLLLGLCPMSRT
ncbi:hypothetical protein K493DRAFT_361576 [Basidiobolus meristosporus CBS 931.73]|uniref:Uncharacterized protein n=1 Tax=Basidiobolus meristosporus CBS 931.73 TaxID=1314790 RepID=A0A1Y1X8N5_9FUNG|nr:hypothetical protein K493DRAFT_361576 [Basidiobolus meristosporus CBS 931.73]|eukprot:ORX82125.1 hypothetical protein K493DRAFT_361576 [Basidiobolus meristosporus CBS 931.73]